MAYTHAYMMKKNLMEIEHMARRTEGRLSTTDRVMPWESDLVSQAATNLRSVYRYRKYKDRFGHTHRPKTPFYPSLGAQGYGGCGTFFGLAKDPVKRACYLEKKIASHAPKCNSGNTKSCDKVVKWESELAAITGNTQIAQGTPADFYYQQAIAYEQQTAEGTTTTGGSIIPIAAVGLASIVFLYGLNEAF